MTKELLQQALIKWYDSGAENRDEFIALVEQALAQQDQPAAWTHHPNPVHHTGPFVEEHLRDVVERTKAMHAVLDSWVVRAQSGQVNIPCPLEFVGAEQPAQEQVVVQKRVRYESGDYSAWVEIPMSEADNQYRDCVEIRKLYTHPAPTQPVLSDEQILDIFNKVSADGIGHYMTAVGRAIEAYYRGGAAS